MADQVRSAPEFDAMTVRLLRREALRRAAEELNTTSGPGLESVLARISADVTADAAARLLPERAAGPAPRGAAHEPRNVKSRQQPVTATRQC